MTSNPLFSVITPSFNQASFLELTMRSVLEQDYLNKEYLVADGGSTDGSVEIVRKYADRLAWWCSDPDKGQAEAVNKGFTRAHGEFIGWVNSDDLLLPGALQQAAQALAANPYLSMVFGDVVSINERGETINVMRYGRWGPEELMAFNIIGQPGVFFRRSALEKAGYLDADYHFLLDHHLWLRIAKEGEIQYIPQPLAAARFHSGAKNVAQATRFGEEAYRIVKWMPTQPELAKRLPYLDKKVWAGAHRINARYLLDGDQPGAALKAYWRSLAAHPPTALREAHRMLFALLSLIGLARLKPVYYRWRMALRKRMNPAQYR